MMINQIKEIKNVGVWSNFSTSGDMYLLRRNLIFGFNGSGKTTLSRVFSFIKHGIPEAAMLDSISYKITFSENSDSTDVVIDQKSSPHKIGKNILIYNTDFVSKNFLWEEGNINGIIYLSEKAIEAKNYLDAMEANLVNIRKERIRIKKVLKSSIDSLENFYDRVSKNIESAIPSDAYFGSYNKESVSQKYECKGIDISMILSLSEMRTYQSRLVKQERLDKLSFSYKIPDYLHSWILSSRSLICERVSDLVPGEFKKHSDALGWAKKGIEYHEDNELESCLLCGSELSDSRRKYIKLAIKISPSEHYRSLSKAIRYGKNIESELEKIIINIPTGSQFILSKRDTYLANREIFIDIIYQLYKYVKRQVIYLKIRRKNPTSRITIQSHISAFNANIWYRRYSRIRRVIDNQIEDHNKDVQNIASFREDAYNRIENHILAYSKAEWKSLTSLYNENLETSAKLYRIEKLLKNEIHDVKKILREQNVDAKIMNDLIWRYLGHKEISLEVSEDKYNIRRKNGNLAKKLSEGERSAISFCYFLAELRARKRDVRKTIAIIDDPVSSLDAAARTHAFSLMTEITNDCAQVILLTHSTGFASMVKRIWDKRGREENYFQFLSLDCRISKASGNRETSLSYMPAFSTDHYSEYHYLFSIVYNAAKNQESDQLFFLPNAIRKFLEIFASFWYPDQKTFATALIGQREKVKGRVDVLALERLIQIESHGTVESLEGHSCLTMQDSISSAVAAIEFVKIVAEDHYKRMKISCKLLS